ncbi:hypothetical protein ACJ5H2_06215 [Nocardioides sp. R1-1]|uniref:hypothetical protein n=1 Tax=Nocardioides sp. R1-1 TaxID=3383502 RepID=UPI0038D1BCDE
MVTSLLDLGTRKFWRAAGRPVDLTGEHGWLRAPTSIGAVVRDGWLAAEAALHGGYVDDAASDAGLLASMAVLDGPGFRADDLRPEVRDFYEHTSAWHVEVWSSWAPWAWPGGELVSRLFGKRVEQLALPMRPLDVARGMDSRVSVIRDRSGTQVAAGWLRTLVATGEFVFSGCYSARSLPGVDRPSVHVAFPLESGNVQVFLRPHVLPDGSLRLVSPPGPFGADGAYVVVEDGGRTYASRAPVHETFHVHLDDRGVLRTDHVLRLGRATAMRLHYRLERAKPA